MRVPSHASAAGLRPDGPVDCTNAAGVTFDATTYNIYTHLGFEDVREEALRIEREGC